MYARFKQNWKKRNMVYCVMYFIDMKLEYAKVLKCWSVGQKRSFFFNQAESGDGLLAEYIFIVGITRAGNKNIYLQTSLTKLAFFIVF